MVTAGHVEGRAELRLNLGCGERLVSSWVNVDYAVGARLARAVPGFAAINRRLRVFGLSWSEGVVVHDLRRPLPWATGSVAAVYSSHTLEHLTREEGAALLAECARVLRPGGVVRIVVPDLAAVVREYSEGRLDGERLLEALGVLWGEGKTGLKRRLAPFVEFPHRCMYDGPALLRAFAAAGLREARVMPPFESAIEDIRALETAERTTGAVVVEGESGGA